MGLLSYFKRQPDPDLAVPAPEPASAEPDAVAAARARARRRLLGATVLLGVGVIGFPLLFETQPRPIPVDIPIEIPSKDKAPALTQPTAGPTSGPAAQAASAATAVQVPTLIVPGTSGAAERAAAAPVEIVERAGDQGRELPPAPREPSASGARSAAASSAKLGVTAPTGQAAVGATKPADDGARARALLDGQGPAVAAAASAADSSNAAPRVVVQVGAYTDPVKLGDARRKLEALGFKTYTQVVETEAGKRTRVRVGPYASRAEADKAAGKIKAAGLPAAILTL